jgi:3-deoxy-D-manno-octulosonate 8-phosphate phosphatase (KDO 8-P phosphatase)
MSGETINKMLDHSLFKRITTLVFDVDGVLTDGSVIVKEDGDLLRIMNVKDGQAIKIALNRGFRIAIITKGSSLGVRKRLEMLGVTDIYDQLLEKTSAMDDLIKKYQLNKSEILYMGDDLPDLVLKNRVSLFCCPNDATFDVIEQADFISPIIGGRGCVRNVIERVLKIQDSWYL